MDLLRGIGATWSGLKEEEDSNTFWTKTPMRNGR